MEYHKIVIPKPDETVWTNIYPISDVHIGNACHNPGAFARYIKRIEEDPDGRWLSVGDLADLIFYSDPRFHVMALDTNITIDDFRDALMKSVRVIVEKLEPIKHKCLGVMTGNHEEKSTQKYHVDVTKEIANRLGVLYLGYSCLLYILFQSKSNYKRALRLYASHGCGGGKRHGSQINKVEDALRLADADVYVMGHVHGKVSSKLQIKGITSTGRPTSNLKVFVVTSSFQDASKPGSISFAERMMMPEAQLGSPIVKVRHGGHNHELEMDVLL